METAHELFIHELQDIYDGEQRLVQALSEQAEESTRPELQKAFSSHLSQTQKQVERLQQVFPTLHVTLVGGGLYAKQAIDAAVVERATSSPVDVVVGYLPGIGELNPAFDRMIIAIHDGVVVAIERGQFAATHRDTIAQSLAAR